MVPRTLVTLAAKKRWLSRRCPSMAKANGLAPDAELPPANVRHNVKKHRELEARDALILKTSRRLQLCRRQLGSNRKIDRCPGDVVEVVREKVQRHVRHDFTNITFAESGVAKLFDI